MKASNEDNSNQSSLKASISAPKNNSPCSNYDHDYGQSKASQSQTNSKQQFDLLSSPLREFIDVISSSSTEDNSNWLFICPCNNKDRDDGGQLVCCDSCNGWQHVSCVGLDMKKLPDLHYCQSCKPELYQHTRQPPTTLIYDLPTSDALSIYPDTSKSTVHPEISAEPINVSFCESFEGKKDAETVPEDEELDSVSCNCDEKIADLILTQRLNDDSNYYDVLTKNKNCQLFNLKNGQKILKASRVIQKDAFVCELKGQIHIFDFCINVRNSYNCLSSFIYIVKFATDWVFSVDCRASSHISRYIRRSCKPNTRVTCCIDPDDSKNVKFFLCALNFIDKNSEITIPIDRNENHFIKYPGPNSKHHWQKYDYSSCLICQCEHSRTPDKSSCPVDDIKIMLKSFKLNRKKANASENDNGSSGSQQEHSSMDLSESSQGTKKSKPTQQGMSREQKKIDYWLRVINEMESTGSKMKRTSRRGRKPKDKSPSFSHQSLLKRKEAKILSRLNATEPQPVNESEKPNPTASEHTNHPLDPSTSNSSTKKPGDTWFFPPKLSDLFFKNNETVSKTDTVIHDMKSYDTASIRSQFPIKLALRRGLYHLLPDYLVDNMPTSSLDLEDSKNPLKRSFNMSEQEDCNQTVKQKHLPEIIIPAQPSAYINQHSSIKNELPIPELRSTFGQTQTFNNSPGP